MEIENKESKELESLSKTELKQNENINDEQAQLSEEEIKQKEHEKKVNKRLTIANIIVMTFTAIFCAFFVFSVVVTNLYDSATVVGTSMSPTINTYALLDGSSDKNDIAYYTHHKTANINDVIIVDYSSMGKNIEAIKRYLAKGGDTICYYNGKLLRNGVALEEKYLDDDYEYLKNTVDESSAEEWKTGGYNQSKSNFEKLCLELLTSSVTGKITYKTQFAQNCKESATYAEKYIKYSPTLSTYVLTIPEDYIFFLGDNRLVSSDCSYFGPIESKYLVARVDFILSYNANVFTKLFTEINYIFA